jgi:hypothetical protein
LELRDNDLKLALVSCPLALHAASVSVEEAVARIEHLKQHGPSDHAFDWRTASAQLCDNQMTRRLAIRAGQPRSTLSALAHIGAIMRSAITVTDRMA